MAARRRPLCGPVCCRGASSLIRSSTWAPFMRWVCLLPVDGGGVLCFPAVWACCCDGALQPRLPLLATPHAVLHL